MTRTPARTPTTPTTPTATGAGRRVLVLEDDAEFRAALHTMLTHRGHEVVGSFDRARDAIAAVVAVRAEVALVDLSLPEMSGLEAIKQFRELAPDMRIVVLSANNTAADLLESLRAGAIGYLVKGARLLDIAGSVDAAASGMSPISPEAGRHLIAEVAPPAAPQPRAAPPASLTAREHDVLALLVEGHAYNDIATALAIGTGTVQNHVKSIYRKLDVTSKAEATAVALRSGIVPKR